MEYLTGTLIGVGVAALVALSGMDRERCCYPIILIVVAAYYVLFAAMGGSTDALAAEIAAGLGFTALAVLGFRKNLLLVAAAVAGHGLFDLVHHLFIQNPGVPVWWPGFCAEADLILGGWFGLRLRSAPVAARRADGLSA